MSAFSDLNTCRQSGMGVGEIPWDKILKYAREKDLDGVMTDVFIIVIRTMDRALMAWHEKEQDKKRHIRDRQAKRGQKQVMPKEDYVG